MEKPTQQINVSISPRLLSRLERVARFYGLKRTEYVRQLISRDVRETEASRQFQAWLRQEERRT